MVKQRGYLFIAAGAFCLLAAALSLSMGAARLSLSQIWRAVLAGPRDTAGYIFWYVRLPRTAACLLAGAALAVSGAVIQGVLNNKLASPGIIGVNAGAGLAVTVCCACGMLSGWAVAGAAFAGAMGAAALVMFISCRTGASRTTVILSGVAVNAVLNALAEAVTTLLPDTAMLNADYRVGGFSAVSHIRLVPAAVLILAALTVLLTLCSDLDVLNLGEETARGLGMQTRRMRTVFLILAAMLAGSAVSFAGLLGFVGLIVPHVVRKTAGDESRFVIPLCALAGAGFVTGCDLLCRVLFAPYELRVGIGMSVLGGPFFLLLLLKRKGGMRHA
ncbi:MAG: iron ABC transporter permease [Oscillospiraceae bacterium]|nr:iron ABC transporter permease [Oscillospiraceae bacterium]